MLALFILIHITQSSGTTDRSEIKTEIKVFQRIPKEFIAARRMLLVFHVLACRITYSLSELAAVAGALPVPSLLPPEPYLLSANQHFLIPPTCATIYGNKSAFP
jgi:hypothetical protein